MHYLDNTSIISVLELQISHRRVSSLLKSSGSPSNSTLHELKQHLTQKLFEIPFHWWFFRYKIKYTNSFFVLIFFVLTSFIFILIYDFFLPTFSKYRPKGCWVVTFIYTSLSLFFSTFFKMKMDRVERVKLPRPISGVQGNKGKER